MMKAKRANSKRGMTGGKWLLPLLVTCIGACSDASIVRPDISRNDGVVAGGRSQAVAKLTGTVDLVWPGGKGAGAPDDGRIAQAGITAFAGVPPGNPGPGSFTYRVITSDGDVHREIEVELTWVGLEDQEAKPGEVRFIGIVVSDTKLSSGSGEGSDTHGDGCGDEGGCSHDDAEGHDEGGCSGGGETGGAGVPGGAGGPGDKVTGATSRVGQVVIGWAKDGGTPAVDGDRISWKWMASDAPKVEAIQDAIADGGTIPWPCKLCEKVILGGNLQVKLGAP